MKLRKVVIALGVSLFGIFAAAAVKQYTIKQIQDSLNTHLKSIAAPKYKVIDEPEFEKSDISGQCFIATQGGLNFKLGLVTIFIFDADNAKELELYGENWRGLVLQGTNLLLDQENKLLAAGPTYSVTYPYELDTASLEGKVDDYKTAIQALENMEWNGYELMPPALLTVKTDADGKFALDKLPKGDFVLFAKASRTLVDEKEYYVWLIKSKDIRGQKQLFLSNDNIMQ